MLHDSEIAIRLHDPQGLSDIAELSGYGDRGQSATPEVLKINGQMFASGPHRRGQGRVE